MLGYKINNQVEELEEEKCDLLSWLQLHLSISANLHQRFPNLLHHSPVAHLHMSGQVRLVR